MRGVMAVVVVIGAGLAAAPGARADGGPVAPVQNGAGVGVPGNSARYVAVHGRGGTVVERLRHGRVEWGRVLRGDLGVPGAAYDGSTTGLSADGRTLVLAAIPRRYPQRRTDLVVVGTRAFHVRARIRLRGFFTVDAVSPDGRRVYLVHYRHGNALRYEVLAYDLPHRRLLGDPIVDPREPDEKMLGTPATRTMSRDGRWAYTLYVRPRGAPFVHALDTRAGTAVCIDLDAMDGAEVSGVRLVAPHAGGPLIVRGPGGPEALVDPRTFAVSEPPGPAAPPQRHHRDARAAAKRGGALPWLAAGAVLAGLALLAGVKRRYARSASFRNAS